MLSLPELQRRVAAGILGDDNGALADLIRGDGLPFDKRLQIYRNNTLISLTEALKSTFPTVAALVGEPFFAFAAKAFIRDQPPRAPRLSEYGDGFAGFLAGFAPAQSLPYLPDVARLEWAVNAAYHAPDDRPLDPRRLAAVPQERYPALAFALRASCRLLRSPYPVDSLWKAHQPGGSLEGLDVAAGGCNLLVFRPAAEVEFMTLDGAGFAFLTALAGGGKLEQAYEAAAAVDPAFDLIAALGAHLGRGTFADFVDGATGLGGHTP
jgi:hypothetical protein